MGLVAGRVCGGFVKWIIWQLLCEGARWVWEGAPICLLLVKGLCTGVDAGGLCRQSEPSSSTPQGFMAINSSGGGGVGTSCL